MTFRPTILIGNRAFVISVFGEAAYGRRVSTPNDEERMPEPPAPQASATPLSPPRPAQPPPFNVMAIIAFVAAFVVPVAGIVCGHITLAEYRRGLPERGREYALAGTILGYIFTAVWLVLGILWIVFVLSHFGHATPVRGGDVSPQGPGRYFPLPTPRITPGG